MNFAISGFGRIGRLIARHYFNNKDKYPNLNLKVINDLSPIENSAYLFKYDSSHGTFKGELKTEKDHLVINDHKIQITNQRDPAEIEWGKRGVDIVMDCTGAFRTKEKASTHLKSGAKKVIISAPGKDVDGTFVYGVNHQDYNPSKDNIISNASCTTNCLAPIASVLHKNFKLIQGFVTTIHSYTSDQRLIDNNHSDLRRGRSAAENMVPTSTGAARAVGLVIPELAGKLDGLAVRVPTSNVSMVDLVAQVEKNLSAEELNNCLKEASESDALKGVLKVSTEALVSSDFKSESASSIVDALSTAVIDNKEESGGTLIKILSWYDNEYAFSCRMLDLAAHIQKTQ